jgi:hypothetical protein
VTFNGLDGELMIAIAGVAAARNLEDIDGSWTVVQAQLASSVSADVKIRVWRKILAAPQTDQAFTISSTAVAHWGAAVIRVAGDFDLTTPIDVMAFVERSAGSDDVGLRPQL